jgi:hypothetical protein
LPAQDVLESFCNLGYAGGCAWTPRERAWDAVRFSVAAPSRRDKGQGECTTESLNARNGDAAQILHLIYVCERDHRPVEHGDLEFDLPKLSCQSPHPNPQIQKMAECFLQSYLKLI